MCLQANKLPGEIIGNFDALTQLLPVILFLIGLIYKKRLISWFFPQFILKRVNRIIINAQLILDIRNVRFK